MADFAAQIRAFQDKVRRNIDIVVQESTAEIAAELVSRTPIDITTLRANWQFTIGAPSGEDFPGAADESPEGSTTAAKLGSEIREVPAGSVTYVVNNRPYMPMIEYGLYTGGTSGKRRSSKTINGFSTQAPAGVRDVTAIGWQTFVKNAIAKIIT
jgi:hypothetical protein